VNPIPGGWQLDWNQTPPWNQAPVLTTSSLGSNYRTPEGHQIPLPISKLVTPLLTTTTTTLQALVRSRSTLGVTVCLLLQFPCLSIKDQLHKILEIAGMEDELEHWRHVHQTLGKSNNMFDGRVAQEIKGLNSRPFFENPSPVGCTELHIGLVLGFDW
jgi:hypothetical protein